MTPQDRRPSHSNQGALHHLRLLHPEPAVVLLAPFLLVVLLAGCMSAPAPTPPNNAGDPSPCESFAIPAIREGASYRYNASGAFMPPAIRTDWIDWRALDPNTTIKPWDPLPQGSLIEYQVASTQPRMDQRGRMVPSHQVAIWIKHPSFDEPIHAYDQWIDNKQGIPVNVHYRSSQWDQASWGDEVIKTSAQLTREGYPHLLLAPQFWQKPFEPETTQSLPISPEYYFPDSDPSPGKLHAAIGSITRNTDDSCQVKIQVDIDWPLQDRVDIEAAIAPFRMELTFWEGLSLPTRVHAIWNQDEDPQEFHLQLVSHDVGSGASLPPPRPPLPIESQLEISDTVDGLPQDATCAYETCLHDAVDAIRLHPDAILWFQQHPDATLHSLSFSQYRTEMYEHRWTVRWIENHAVMEAHYFRFVNSSNGQVIINSESSNDPQPEMVPQLVTIDALAQVHRNVFGGDPEWLICYLFHQPECGVNTMFGAGANQPFEPDPGLRIQPGVQIDMVTGRIHQIDTWDSAILGPSPPTRLP